MTDQVQVAVDIGRAALVLAFKISLPLLLTALVVGLAISIVQAVTQLQEQTLSFIPKIVATMAVLFLLMPWIIVVLMEYTVDLVKGMNTYFR